jgi:hypothetical protein
VRRPRERDRGRNTRRRRSGVRLPDAARSRGERRPSEHDGEQRRDTRLGHEADRDDDGRGGEHDRDRLSDPPGWEADERHREDGLVDRRR